MVTFMLKEQVLCSYCICDVTKIPSLPTKTLYSNEGDTVKYRQRCFEDFLNFVAKHDSLIYSPELLAFLKLPDPEFEKYKTVVYI